MKMFEQAAEAIRAQGDLEKLREMYRIPGKELALFGAGECGHKVYEILQEAGGWEFPVSAIIVWADRLTRRQGL